MLIAVCVLSPAQLEHVLGFTSFIHRFGGVLRGRFVPRTWFDRVPADTVLAGTRLFRTRSDYKKWCVPRICSRWNCTENKCERPVGHRPTVVDQMGLDQVAINHTQTHVYTHITVRAEIFAVVLFSRISRVKPSRKFPLQFMSIYSNDNNSKIAKLTTRELPHLAKTVKIMAYTYSNRGIVRVKERGEEIKKERKLKAFTIVGNNNLYALYHTTFTIIISYYSPSHYRSVSSKYCIACVKGTR